MNKYLKQIEKAKTMITLSKVAEHIGVKLGRIKDINKAKTKMIKALEKERKQVKKDYEKIVKVREDNHYKELKEINHIRNKLDTYLDVNNYLKKMYGEFQSLAELNALLWDYRFKNSDLKLKDLQKVAKEKGFKLDYYIDGFMEKIEKFKFENYTPMLKFYGFKESDIKEMAKEFNNAGYKRQDYFLNILHRYAIGKNKYPTEAEESERIDHNIARSNFKTDFDIIIKGGKTTDGKQNIDEL